MLDWLRKRSKSYKKKSTAPSRQEVATAAERTLADDGYVDTGEGDTGNLDRDFFALMIGAEEISERELIKLEIDALQALGETIRNSASLAKQVPRIPELLPRLMQSLGEGKHAVAELARQIGSDPTMVAEVLRAANSPYYRTRNEITSIDHAIVVLGDGGVRETIARIALQPVIQFDPGFYSQTVAPRIWEQSGKCAVVCSVLSEALNEDRFNAYLAGLMHNVGATILFRALSRGLGGAPPPACERFRRVVEASVPLLSCRVAYEWEFPTSVVAALNPNNAGLPLRRIVAAGERLAQVHTLIAAERYDAASSDERWIHDAGLGAHQRAGLAELNRYAPPVLA